MANHFFLLSQVCARAGGLGCVPLSAASERCFNLLEQQ